MRLREYSSEDKEELVQLFYETVHSINAADYDAAQLTAWAPDNIDVDQWCGCFETGYAWVVEEDGQIIGFGNLKSSGRLDRLYVHKDHQGKGVGTLLAEAIEKQARRISLKELRVEASITARPFFLQKGYRLFKENTVLRGDQKLRNYTMTKKLLPET